MTIVSFTVLLYELNQRGITVTMGRERKLKVSSPKGTLSAEIRQALVSYKDFLLAFYLVPAEQDVPQSFKDRPCVHCGKHDARRLPDGSWICVCYWQGCCQAIQSDEQAVAA